MPILDEIMHATQAQSVSIAAFVLAMLSTLLFMTIRHIFLPTGLRRTKNGSPSRLPAGPKGIPLFGSLLQLQSARSDINHHWVSGLSCSTRELLLRRRSSEVL